MECSGKFAMALTWTQTLYRACNALPSHNILFAISLRVHLKA